jgi:hypothetical protein
MFYTVCWHTIIWKDAELIDMSRLYTNLLYSHLTLIHILDEGWHVVKPDIPQDDDRALVLMNRQYSFKVRTAGRQHQLQINTQKNIIIKLQSRSNNKFKAKVHVTITPFNVVHVQCTFNIPPMWGNNYSTCIRSKFNICLTSECSLINKI